MNPLSTIVVSMVAASAAAAGVSLALRPSGAGDQALLVSRLQSNVQDLEARNRELSQRLEELATRSVPAAAPAAVERTAAPSLAPELVAAAVEAYLQKREGAPLDGALAAAAEGFDVEKDLDSLVGTNFWGNSAAWKRAFEAGRMDEVIAAFEARAKANPNDIRAQMDLANACMAYLQMDQSKWQYSMKADAQFDKVLAIDSAHWEARFTKAMSYTFWPEFLGKKKEAIQHFETLLEQQESLPPRDHHAQTYLYLGNMLIERDPGRAREVWQKGLTRHPNNEELRQKLGGN